MAVSFNTIHFFFLVWVHQLFVTNILFVYSHIIQYDTHFFLTRMYLQEIHAFFLVWFCCLLQYTSSNRCLYLQRHLSHQLEGKNNVPHDKHASVVHMHNYNIIILYIFALFWMSFHFLILNVHLHKDSVNNPE